ncbi:MAG: hypothetical protein ACOX5G_12445 [Kiritimatiellia bacterium]
MAIPGSLRRIGAIARLTLQAAFRSRLVTALAVLLAAATFGLPLLVGGDGTPEGDLRVAVRYAFGTGMGLLVLATLWASCGAVSLETSSKRLALTCVKPVRSLELWFGKWLGILALDLLLLAGAGIATRAAIAWKIASHPADAPAPRLITRARHAPLLPSLRDEAGQLLAEHPPPPDIDPATALEVVMAQLPERYQAIPARETVRWSFALDRPLPENETLWLRMQFATDSLSRQEVSAACRLLGDNGGESLFRVDDFTSSDFTLPVDAAPLAGASAVVLEFTYAPETPDAGALLIQPRRGLALLEPVGPFAPNLVRALLVEASILAALAALGVTFGMLFAFPVAAFCATGLLLSTLVSAYAMSEVIDPEEPPKTAMARLSQSTAVALTSITEPLLAPSPIEHLAEGERVPAAEIGASIGWNLLAAPLVLAALGAALFSRKESLS